MFDSVKVSSFLTYMKIPFGAIAVILFALELAQSILRARRFSTLLTLSTAAAAIYAVLALIMAIAFLILNYRVSRYAKQSSSGMSTSGSKSRMSVRIDLAPPFASASIDVL